MLTESTESLSRWIMHWLSLDCKLVGRRAASCYPYVDSEGLVNGIVGWSECAGEEACMAHDRRGKAMRLANLSVRPPPRPLRSHIAQP